MMGLPPNGSYEVADLSSPQDVAAARKMVALKVFSEKGDGPDAHEELRELLDQLGIGSEWKPKDVQVETQAVTWR